jgi:Schlafen, AlbA_2
LTSFLERFFKKARPDEITYQDFVSFLRQGIEEHQTLEYKPRGLLVKRDDTIIRPRSPQEVSGFIALAKTVSGFANAEGGLLVLGVNEKPERYKGTTVKIRPGAISALPINITREMIENHLLTKINPAIEGIKIVPLRSSSRSKQVIYLIDVPQSIRAPHRVNELYYFQRINFSTIEMKHFQIADLFGKRLAPDLDLQFQKEDSGDNLLKFRILIRNQGRAVAKYVTCVCQLIDGSYELVNSDWQNIGENKWRFSISIYAVVYPDVLYDVQYLV